MFDFLKSDNSENLLPPPVRRLVFGEKTEEEELKDLVGDFYDQLERMEEAHDSHYERMELVVDGSGRDQVVNVKLKKKRKQDARRMTRNSDDSNYNLIDRSFTLTELMNTDRNYLTNRVEQETEPRENDSTHSTTVEVREGEAPSTSELMEEDTPDDSGSGFESPLESSSDESDSSVKESILDHTN